jgi:hypothetical protein
VVDKTKALTGAELSAKRLADAAEERKKNAGKPGYSVAGVKLNGNRHGVTFCASAAKERSIALKMARQRELLVAKRGRAEAKRKLKRLEGREARKGLPYFIKDREKMAEKDEAQRAKISTQGVMKSPEEIQQLLVDLECDPIARMAAIAERAEKAGELNIASNLYKELAQYAAPKRKAAEPKVIKDKNLLTMSEEELLAEIARLESSV